MTANQIFANDAKTQALCENNKLTCSSQILCLQNAVNLTRETLKFIVLTALSAHCQTLRIKNVSFVYNDLAQALAEAINENCNNLKHLSIVNCSFCYWTLELFVEHLHKNESLVSLDLSENNLGHVVMPKKTLENLFCKVPNLSCLNLANNGFSEKSIENIEFDFCRAHKLEQFDFSGNDHIVLRSPMPTQIESFASGPIVLRHGATNRQIEFNTSFHNCLASFCNLKKLTLNGLSLFHPLNFSKLFDIVKTLPKLYSFTCLDHYIDENNFNRILMCSHVAKWKHLCLPNYTLTPTSFHLLLKATCNANHFLKELTVKLQYLEQMRELGESLVRNNRSLQILNICCVCFSVFDYNFGQTLEQTDVLHTMELFSEYGSRKKRVSLQKKSLVPEIYTRHFIDVVLALYALYDANVYLYLWTLDWLYLYHKIDTTKKVTLLQNIVNSIKAVLAKRPK